MEAFIQELWMILKESSVWLIVGFAIAGIVHALVPREWMLKHLSGGGIWPIAKASLLGIPLPLCSCSVIPVAAGLRSRGASKGASAAFAISTPQTGEESIPITWALFGPIFAFTRPVVAVITGLIAGVLIDWTCSKDGASSEDSIEDPDAFSLSIANSDDARAAVEQVESKGSSGCCGSKTTKSEEPAGAGGSCCSSKRTPEPVASSCCSAEAAAEPAGSCCSSERSDETGIGIGGRVVVAIKHGFGTMLIDLALWLTIGLVLAAAIGALVPEEWLTEHAGSGIVPKLVMLVVGVPLYICATSSTPLAWKLVAAGLSPGAALVMLLSGPATNVATMSWLIKDLGVRALVIYLGVIASVALGAGVLFDAVFYGMIEIAQVEHSHDHGGVGAWGMVKQISAIIMIILLSWAMGMKARGALDKRGIGRGSSGGGCCGSKSGPSCGCA